MVYALENDDCSLALAWATKEKVRFHLHRYCYLLKLSKAVEIWKSLIHDINPLSPHTKIEI